MYTIYKMLCTLIDETYPDTDENKERYKKFYLIKKGISNSKHGCYYWNNHQIEIYNLYRDNSAIVATIIHELAHHVDWCRRKKSDHSKIFYDIFFELLKKGLDMNYYSKDDLLDYKSDAADSKKVKAMLESYTPNSINNSSSQKRIRVYNSFKIKDDLKSLDYRFDGLSSTWTKVVDESDLDEEIRRLDSLSAEYKVMSVETVEFNQKIIVSVSGNTFNRKEELKADGFKFDSVKKKWTKYVETPEQGNKYKGKYLSSSIKVSIK